MTTTTRSRTQKSRTTTELEQYVRGVNITARDNIHYAFLTANRTGFGAANAPVKRPKPRRAASQLTGRRRTRKSGPAQAPRELRALALAQGAERLAGRDPTAVQNLGGLHAPDLGEASTMSKTFAVSRYGGGSSSSAPIDTLRALRSRLSCARSARTSFALPSAFMR